MSLAQDNAWYSISRPLTGDAQIRDLALTGWGNQLGTVSAGGVMFWKVDTSNNLKLYSDPLRASEIATGAINGTTDLVTLSASNASGITGTARVIHTAALESTGRVIVSYGDEPDLEDVLQSSSNFLSISQWRSVARFEKAFCIAKSELDTWIDAALAGSFPVNAAYQIDRAMLANPAILRGCHAMLAASVILQRRGSLDSGDFEQVERLRKMARERFTQLRIEQDYADAGVVDNVRRPSVMRIGRG